MRNFKYQHLIKSKDSFQKPKRKMLLQNIKPIIVGSMLSWTSAFIPYAQATHSPELQEAPIISFSSAQTNKPLINIDKFLEKKVILPSVDYFPAFRMLDHTMCFSLDKYAEQKLPLHLFQKALIHEWKIEIHGIYPLLFSENAGKLGFDVIEQISFQHNKKEKRFNYIRPQFFIGYKKNKPNTLIIAVTPGEDYIYHYASMVRHYLSKLTKNAEDLFEIHRYPDLEDKLADWTNLDNKFVHSHDIVILGSVEKIEQFLLNKHKAKLLSKEKSDYYESTRYQLSNGKVVNFLGVKYSYWGCMSGKIVKKLCELGAQEIIYSAKLGSMTKPEDLYQKIYAPTKYLTMKFHSVIRFIVNVPNKFVEKFPQLNSEWHVSIPTVLEEDFEQRRVATQVGAQSIDNEISRMAAAIEDYNLQQNTKIPFCAIHFATDYVRKKGEKKRRSCF
ncbi:MAG: hypothetical protein BGO76_09020 [Caedibacter sp. 38-128]|nr:hypothetical protein [Holosporales bacterium]OJX05529.1 MAG: hypothetical protein BGO76_09020 [Caedibacter sp. 38-128]